MEEGGRAPVGTFPLTQVTGAQLVSFAVPVNLANGSYAFEAVLVRAGSDALNPANHLCPVSRVDVWKYDLWPVITLSASPADVHSRSLLQFIYSVDPGTVWDMPVDVYILGTDPGGASYFVTEGYELVPGSQPQAFDQGWAVQALGSSVLAALEVPLGLPDGTYTFEAVLVRENGDVTNPANWVSNKASCTVNKNDIPPAVSLYLNGTSFWPGAWADVDYSIDPGTVGGTRYDAYMKINIPGIGDRYVNSSHELSAGVVPMVSDGILPDTATGRLDLWGGILQYNMAGGTYHVYGRLCYSGTLIALSNMAETSFVFNNPPPVISVSGVPGQVEPGQVVTPALTADKPVKRVQILWNGGPVWDSGEFTPSPGPHSASLTIPEVPAGYYTLTFRAWDEMGQTGETNRTTYVYIDTTPPGISVSLPGSVTQGQWFTAGMSTNEDVVRIEIWFQGSCLLGTGTSGRGPWSVNVQAPWWREGNYGFDFYARDARGNIGHEHRTIFLDDVNPPYLISTTEPSCNQFHRGNTFVLTGCFSENINRVHAWIEGTPINSEYDVSDTSCHTISFTVPGDAGYGWYTAKFQARDTGNNWSGPDQWTFAVIPSTQQKCP